MSMLIPTTLTEAVTALANAPSSMVLAGGTDAMVEVNGGHRRPDAVIAVGRCRTELRTWSHDPAGRSCASVPGSPTASWRQPVSAMGAGPQPGGAHGRVATDPPRGDARRQRGHLLAGRRRPARSRCARRGHSPRVCRRCSFDGIQRLHDRPEANGYVAGRVDRIRVHSGICRLAGLRQGRGAQRNGHLQRRRLPGRRRRGRRALALGSVGPTIIRCHDAESFCCLRGRPRGRSVADSDVSEFGRLAAAAARPIDDHRSTAEYRRHAVAVLARRLLRRAFPNG